MDMVATLILVAQLTISWSWISEIQEVGFELERAPSGCTQWSLIARLPADTMQTQDTYVQGECYRVRAFDANQFYPYSNVAIAPDPPPPPGDTTPPSVTISNPQNGATVARRSIVTIRSTFSDNVGVTSVRYLVNGTTLSCGGIVNQCNWSVPNPPNKIYTIRVEAKDAAGNTGAAQVSVRSSR